MWLQKYEIVNVQGDSTPTMANYTLKYFNDDGRTTERTERTGEPSSLSGLAKRNINDLERIDKVNTDIANPPLGEVNLTPPPLTPEQAHEQEVAKKKNELNQAAIDLKLGVITQEQYDIILVEYKDLISNK